MSTVPLTVSSALSLSVLSPETHSELTKANHTLRKVKMTHFSSSIISPETYFDVREAIHVLRQVKMAHATQPLQSLKTF
jgi:hypothetical protein